MPDQDNKDPQQDRQNGGPPPPNFLARGGFGWILLIGILIILVVLFNQQSYQAKGLDWQEFLNFARMGAFDGAVQIRDDRITATLKSDAEGIDAAWTEPYNVYTEIDRDTKEYRLQVLDGLRVPSVEQAGTPFWVQLLFYYSPFLILGLLLYIFVFRTFRGGAGGGGMLGNFGRSRHKLINKEHSNITLGDVAGIQEAKEEVTEIVEFLKNPKKFQRLGGRVPRGVLLIGEPGCGKTLLAKAVAGEAEVPFFSISGSDFVEMFVGVGASRVRDLFRQAKENSPCIIFLDEIDAVGRRRGSGFSSGGHDEREQTLNAILVEMDGFETNDQVIVMAATNRGDVLDPALTRPGRFDRSITVPLPDLRGRAEILKVHSRKIKLGPDVDLEVLARGTPMFSGADLAAIINEAAIGATLKNKDFVEHEDLEEARDKVRFGREYKSRKIDEKERIITAYHEAGHAVVQMLVDADPLHKVTIIPRGHYLGATFSLPEKDRLGVSRKWLDSHLQVLCAGRIAEFKKTGDYTSGAGGDIQMATNFARRMVFDWGMSDKLGFVQYGLSGNDYYSEKSYSDETAKMADEEIKQIVDTAYADATKLIEDNWDHVVAIAEALLVHESLSRDDVDKLMRGEEVQKPSVADVLKDMEQQDPPKPVQEEPKDELGDAPGAMPSPA